jgi:hypothetical protein
MFLWAKLKAQFVTGPSPIPALTCPDAPEPGLLRSRPAQSISLGYGFQPHLPGVGFPHDSIRNTGAI